MAGPLDSAIADGAPPSAGVIARTVTTPRAFVAAEAAEVTYSGMSPDYPGVWVIDVRLPDAPSIARQVPVFLVGDNGAVSNAVTVWVED